jgi:hypothetical protein
VIEDTDVYSLTDWSTFRSTFATGIGSVNAKNLVMAFGATATATPTATATQTATATAIATATATMTATPTAIPTATTGFCSGPLLRV